MAGVGGMSRIADRNHFGLLGEPFDQRRCGALVAFKARIERPDDPVDEIAIVRTRAVRSEEHTSELQSLMRILYAVFCLKKKMISFHTLIMFFNNLVITTYTQDSSISVILNN